jgi:hypothetical protein
MFKYLFNSKKHPFNQASNLYDQLRNLDTSGDEYDRVVGEIIKLCCNAISLNQNDGDAHVLLANAYLLVVVCPQ